MFLVKCTSTSNKLMEFPSQSVCLVKCLKVTTSSKSSETQIEIACPVQCNLLSALSLPHKNIQVHSWCTWILHLNTSSPFSQLPQCLQLFCFFRIYTTASSLYLKVSQPGPCSSDGRFVPGVLLPVQESSCPEKRWPSKGERSGWSQNRLHEHSDLKRSVFCI